jgi:superfamily I DNA and RNA helicase
MFQASIEQQMCIDATLGGNHVVVCASPGSGKSALALEIAKQAADENVILVTYNRALADSTKSKIPVVPTTTTMMMDGEMEEVKHEEKKSERSFGVFTYHALLTSLTGVTVHDDLLFLSIMQMLTSDGAAVDDAMGVKLSTWKHRDATILIIDESQDCRPHYFELVAFLIQRILINRAKLRVIVVGDEMQTLYHFYGRSRADSRYLTLAPQLFGYVNDLDWSRQELTRTYRCSKPISRFANQFTRDRGREMVTNNTSDVAPTQVYVLDVYKDAASLVVESIQRAHQESNISYNDILVLCTSMNARSPAVNIVSELVAKGIPTNVHRSGALTDSCSTSTSNGSVTFRTFCSSKGLEAKFVIVIFARSIFLDELDNARYVALTRASSQLLVIMHKKDVYVSDLENMIDGLDESEIAVTVKRKIPKNRKPKSMDAVVTKKSMPKSIHVDVLFVFLDVYDLATLMQQVTTTTVREPYANDADFASNDHLSEVVSENRTTEFMQRYVKTLTITSSGGTEVGLASVVGNALVLAVELFHTLKTPARVRSTITKMNSKFSNSDQDKRLRKLVDDAMRTLVVPREDGASRETFVLRRLKALAMFAIVIDAVGGYSDRLALVDNFDFIVDKVVYTRFRLTIEVMTELMELHNIRSKDLRWQQDDGTFFKIIDADGTSSSVCINTCPSARTEDGRFLFNIVHKPSLSHCDTLLSVATQCALSQCANDPHAYVLNLFDGAAIECKLAPTTDVTRFMTGAIDARLDEAPTLSDEEFLATHCAMVEAVCPSNNSPQQDDDPIDTIGMESDTDDEEEDEEDEENREESIAEMVSLRREMAELQE